MNELIELCREILRRRCLLVNGQMDVDSVKLLLDLQTAVNAYAIFSDADSVAKIWTKIESTKTGVSLFLDTAIELRLRSGLTTVKWNELLTLIQQSTGLGEGPAKVGPSGIYQRVLSEDERISVLKRQSWLIVVFLLVMGQSILTPEEILAHTNTKEE